MDHHHAAPWHRTGLCALHHGACLVNTVIGTCHTHPLCHVRYAHQSHPRPQASHVCTMAAIPTRPWPPWPSPDPDIACPRNPPPPPPPHTRPSPSQQQPPQPPAQPNQPRPRPLSGAAEPEGPLAKNDGSRLAEAGPVMANMLLPRGPARPVALAAVLSSERVRVFSIVRMSTCA